MKLAILVLFAAALSAVSFASPNYRKFKYLRVQQGETRLHAQYDGPEHTDICTVLERGDKDPTLFLIDLLCNLIDSGETSPYVDRITETHWGLCVHDAPTDRLRTICLALMKGYLECPSLNIHLPGFCGPLIP